jgi:hypothetical protein
MLSNLSDLQSLTVVSRNMWVDNMRDFDFNMRSVNVRDWVLIVVWIGINCVPTIVLNVVVGVMHWFYSVLLFLLGNVVYFVLFERQCCDVVPMIEVVIQRVMGLVIFVVLKIVIVVSLLMNSW